MPLLSLTSDYGTQDHYVASVKAYLHAQLEKPEIIDISHQIECFNIPQAAYILKNAYQYFPPKSVHLIFIDSTQHASNRYILVEHQEQYFISPDNGLLSLVLPEFPNSWVSVRRPEKISPTDPLLEIIAPAAVKLIKSDYNSLNCGTPTQNAFILSEFRPAAFSSQLQGTVVHVDKFGNAITNITKEIFEEFIGDAKFEIQYRSSEPINEISSHYKDVPFGESLAIFNAYGNLELAIHADNASKLFNVKVGHTITVIKY